jgi:metallo-beta-lactamase class B
VRLRDVRVILNSHAHLDHAGGIAELQRDTGARVVARESGAHALAQGHGDRDDPQFASAKPFAPVANVHAIGDGETLTLGDIAITAHATPGHTPGSTSWTWDACEGTHCLHVAYADSLSAISDDDYRYGDDAAHPGVAAAFRASIDRVAALPCDILITPHPDASDLWQRVGASASRPLVDSGACRGYAERARTNFEKRLAKERGDAK